MRLNVEVDITIDQPLPFVAEFTCDLANALAWHTNVRSAQPHQPPPVRVGAKITFSVKSLGRMVTCTYQVVELATQHRLVMRGVDAEQPVETTYVFEALPLRSTRVRLRHRGGAPGAFRSGLTTSERGVRRAMSANLAQLKAVLETPV